MLLQIAVDLADTAGALCIAEQIFDVIDIFEVGTPLIMKEGVVPVKALKERFPAMTVLADTKIMDAGAVEAEAVCRAGADLVTVLALADDATVAEVAETAHRFDRKAMADLICVRDIPLRARELVRLGVDYICVHTGVDMQRQGRTPLDDLRELVRAVDPSAAAVAGGINLSPAPLYAAERPAILIAGGALYNAPDVRAAVIAMKEAME